MFVSDGVNVPLYMLPIFHDRISTRIRDRLGRPNMYISINRKLLPVHMNL